MTLVDRLNSDMKQAMREKDKDRLSVIRMVKAALQNESIHLGTEELTEEETMSILSKELKQRTAALKEFQEAGRDDLSLKIEKEIEILHEYMPEQLSEEELEMLIKETIADLQVVNKSEFGKVMGSLMSKVKGKADGSRVQEIVKAHLE